MLITQVHERGLESDFSMALLIEAVHRRQVMHRSEPSAGRRLPLLKLILMSATVQTEKFTSYLNHHIIRHAESLSSKRTALEGVDGASIPVLTIPGRTFPVDVYYRADFETEARFGEEGRDANDSVSMSRQFRYGGHPVAGSIDYDLLVIYLLFFFLEILFRSFRNVTLELF